MTSQLSKLREKAEKILFESTHHSNFVSVEDFAEIVQGLNDCHAELQATQLQLKEASERLTQWYDQAPSGYVTLDKDGKVLQSNDTFAEMVTKDGLSIKNLNFAEFIGAKDNLAFHDFLKHPEAKNLELKIPREGNDTFCARLVAIRPDDSDEGTDNQLIFVVVCDISKQKIVEALLVESEFKYRSLVNSGKALIWTSGPDKLCNYFNDVWLNFTGRALEMELGNGWMDSIHPNDLQQCLQTYWAAFDKREPFSMEYRLRNYKGKYKWILDKGVPHYSQYGEFVGYIGHCFDISEIKEAEAKITKKNEKLRKLNAEKDKFFSIIAHDLRSPFNSFLGLTQLMAEELPRLKISEIQYFMSSLSRSATHLYGLLENLLEWSSLKRGIIGFDPSVFEAKSRILEILQLITEAARSKGIDVEILITEEIQIFADIKMFESIIRNLVSNAIKFSLKGGKVVVGATMLDDKYVQFSIKDSGIGMSNDVLEKLFRLHQQTSRIGTDGEPSSGLGLILCKDFVEKHGGEIWAESEEGKGSEFFFTIPCRAEN